MRRRIGLILACLMLATASSSQAIVHDIRSFIDSGSRYVPADSLRAAATYSDTVWVTGARTIACDVYVVGLVTNVVVRLEGSNNGVNFMNLNATGANTTITADGQYSLIFENAAVMRYYRLYWVSEAGGTAAVIYPAFRVGDRVNP